MFTIIKTLLEWIMILVIIPTLFIGILVLCIFALVPFAFMFASWYMRIKERKLQRRKKDGANVAFFHPYCNAGGGGERVLWVAIRAFLTRYPDTNIFIYTVETVEPQAIFDRAHNHFNVTIDSSRVTFVRLTLKKAIEAETYPYCTMILQSLGFMFLGMEALLKLNPDVFIDTTGCAFTYPIFRYLGACPVGCYTHYPAITRAMTRRVAARVAAHNNAGAIARNPLATWLKLLYYKMFAALYGAVGRCAHVVMANGTWTEDHLNDVWGVPLRTTRVYPPCDVSELKKLTSLAAQSDEIVILSVAQFRPEKDHPLMLQAMYELRSLLAKNEELWNRIKLVLVGSTRHAADRERAANLRDLAAHLSLERAVRFRTDVPRAALLDLYRRASLAIHTMWNEHFGIGVVECMAAGLVTVAHRSGGPLADIVCAAPPARTGFLAQEPKEYAHAILEAIALSPEERANMIEAARASVDRFSETEFEKAFVRAVEPLMVSE